MNRTVRAAAFAAAALASVASASTSAPADAANGGTPASQESLFSTMWKGAVAAIVGETPAAPAGMEAAPQPRTLAQLVEAHSGASTADREQDCLASAIYFEARGEPIEGQLAVAEVVLNRAASGRYPADLCKVVEQPWQFSFVNATGRIPNADRGSDAWRKAAAIAEIARKKLADTLPEDVLWYHATYVSPSWGKRLSRQTKIGLHIFYS